MVEIIRYESANKNKTIGFVEVRVPIVKPTVIVLRKISHLQSGDRRWFNLPSFSRENPDGTIAYFKYFEFETQVYNGQLLEALNQKVREYCKEQGIHEVEPMNLDTFPTSMDELPF